MTRFEAIENQVQLALSAIKRHGYTATALITSTKLSARAKKESFGFRFEVKECHETGDIITNEDGSISKVEAILI